MPITSRLARSSRIFPPTPQIDFDEPAGEEGDAWYRGLNAAGQPIFAVREDYVMIPSSAFHELGHAYQDVVQAERWPRPMSWRKYWTYRGFPATWQDALREAYWHEDALCVAHAAGTVVA